jgi:hypothetical protein
MNQIGLPQPNDWGIRPIQHGIDANALHSCQALQKRQSSGERATFSRESVQEPSQARLHNVKVRDLNDRLG